MVRRNMLNHEYRGPETGGNFADDHFQWDYAAGRAADRDNSDSPGFHESSSAGCCLYVGFNGVLRRTPIAAQTTYRACGGCYPVLPKLFLDLSVLRLQFLATRPSGGVLIRTSQMSKGGGCPCELKSNLRASADQDGADVTTLAPV